MNSKILDQFYTKTEIALSCYSKIKEYVNIDEYFLIEPSAGTGSFSNLFHNNSIKLDLDPKSNDIIKQDFFDFKICDVNKNNEKNITIGNPPFGKNSSLAIKFFNKSATYSEYICMILPQTFKKDSVINKLDGNFHLLFEEVLPLNSFIFNKKEFNVKCIFQIWKKSIEPRIKILERKDSNYFQFVKSKDSNIDFAIRRIGNLSGKIILNFVEYKESSHYYIKVNTNVISQEKLIFHISKIYSELQTISRYSVGTPSLSKNEFIKILEREINRDL